MLKRRGHRGLEVYKVTISFIKYLATRRASAPKFRGHTNMCGSKSATGEEYYVTEPVCERRAEQ